VRALLRKTFTSSNPIENMFSRVRDCEGSLKRHRESAMLQRRLVSTPLHSEQGVHGAKGYPDLARLIASIKEEQEDQVSVAAWRSKAENIRVPHGNSN
jgi:hypothetical protein